MGKQSQKDMEKAFFAYFGDKVSECNPCFSEEGFRGFSGTKK